MSEDETYIIFQLGHATYAIPSRDVTHIEMLEHITPVPNTAAAVEGIVFSRGQLFPAVNLRVRFGLPAAPHTERSRLLFVRVQQRTVALITDSAREFRTIRAVDIRPVEAEMPGVKGRHVRGAATLGERLVLIVDVIAVLELDDPAPLAQAAALAARS